MPDPAPAPSPRPLATWLVPVVGIALIAAIISVGRGPIAPTPLPPPGLRTPEGSVPQALVPLDQSEPEPEPVEGITEVVTEYVPPEAPPPTVPVYAGATLLGTEPVYTYSVHGDFTTVRDFYLGYFGERVQYAEVSADSKGHKRAVIFRANEEEAVQLSATDDPSLLSLAIGPLSMLTGHPSFRKKDDESN